MCQNYFLLYITLTPYDFGLSFIPLNGIRLVCFIITAYCFINYFCSISEENRLSQGTLSGKIKKLSSIGTNLAAFFMKTGKDIFVSIFIKKSHIIFSFLINKCTYIYFIPTYSKSNKVFNTFTSLFEMVEEGRIKK